MTGHTAETHKNIRKNQSLNLDDYHHPVEKIEQLKRFNFNDLKILEVFAGKGNLSKYYNTISKDVLDDINEEYQAFITQKENMIMILKDFKKKMNTQIEDLKLPVLDKYLEPKYAYVKNRVFKCELCNVFTAGSKQSLSAHKRGCKKAKQPLMSVAYKPSIEINTMASK